MKICYNPFRRLTRYLLFVLTLAINTATQQTELAILQIQGISNPLSQANAALHSSAILFEKSWPSKRNEAEILLPTFEEALQKSQLTFDQIKAIFVVSGPGSFSGLRVGITMANALSYSRNLPIFSCDTFDLLWYKIPPEKRTETAVLLYGGADFVAFKNGDASKNPKESSSTKQFSFTEFEKNLDDKKFTQFLVDLPSEKLIFFQKIIERHGLKLLKDELSFGQAVLSFFEQQPQADQGSNLFQSISPIYLQKPHITQSKKQIFA